MAVPPQTPEDVRCEMARLHDLGFEAVMDHGPRLLLDARVRGVYDGVKYREPDDSYTRELITAGEHDEVASLAMAWPPGLQTHIHGHGWLEDPEDPRSYRPSWCIDLIMEGVQLATSYRAHRTDEPWVFEVHHVESRRVGEGRLITVRPPYVHEPFLTDLHMVHTPEPTRSIHTYARNLRHCVSFVPEDDELPRPGRPANCRMVVQPLPCGR